MAMACSATNARHEKTGPCGSASVAATAAGDSLWYRSAGRAVLVASEPGDDEPGWTEVADRSVVVATPALVSAEALSSTNGRIAIH